MPLIRTLLGDVDASSLGITYFHEHTISQPPRHFECWDQDMVLDDVGATARELADFRAAGGTCVVDGSTIDYGRNIVATAEVARVSGCHVVGTSGYNKAAYFSPEINQASIEELQARVARDVSVGMDGTPHKPGSLKFGTSYYHMTATEERAARAVCRVQRESGLPLYTHTEVGTFALEQIDLIKQEGVDLSAVCIGHLDRNPDLWYIREVARHGVFLGIDQISKVKYSTDQVRTGLIIALIRAGYQDRILISGDMARRSYLRAYGGGPGLRYIASTFVPRLVTELRDCGFGASEVERLRHALLIDNPLSFLAMKQ